MGDNGELVGNYENPIVEIVFDQYIAYKDYIFPQRLLHNIPLLNKF